MSGSERGNRARYFILDCEDVIQIAVIALCPDMAVGSCLNELGGDPQAIASPSDAPLDNELYAKSSGNLRYLDVPTAKGKG